MFNNTLFSKISEKLKEKELSINSICKAIETDVKVHRLYLSGYLKALVDMGYLDEKRIPPSKIYKLKPQKKNEGIYEVVGKQIKKMGKDEGEMSGIAVAALQRIFKRAIFREEIKKCGLDNSRIRAKEVKDGEELKELRKLLNRMNVIIPEKDACYTNEKHKEEVAEVLLRIVEESFSIKRVRVRTKQIKLDEMGRLKVSKDGEVGR